MDDILADDRIAAAALRRLVGHLRHRSDVQNVDLMGHSGFCRNCLSEWLEDAAHEAGQPIDREAARQAVYGEPYAAWKARQPDATPEQLDRMAASLQRNEGRDG